VAATATSFAQLQREDLAIAERLAEEELDLLGNVGRRQSDDEIAENQHREEGHQNHAQEALDQRWPKDLLPQQEIEDEVEQERPAHQQNGRDH